MLGRNNRVGAPGDPGDDVRGEAAVDILEGEETLEVVAHELQTLVHRRNPVMQRRLHDSVGVAAFGEIAAGTCDIDQATEEARLELGVEAHPTKLLLEGVALGIVERGGVIVGSADGRVWDWRVEQRDGHEVIGSRIVKRTQTGHLAERRTCGSGDHSKTEQEDGDRNGLRG